MRGFAVFAGLAAFGAAPFAVGFAEGFGAGFFVARAGIGVAMERV
jgi:hypothetical protein